MEALTVIFNHSRRLVRGFRDRQREPEPASPCHCSQPNSQDDKYRHAWCVSQIKKSTHTSTTEPLLLLQALHHYGQSRQSRLLHINPGVALWLRPLLFSNPDHSFSSKSWLNRSVPPPQSRGEPGPLCQRSLWCWVSLANLKQKPKYAAEPLTPRWMMGFRWRILKTINIQRGAV